MFISTLDPISMRDVSDIDSAPYVVDGEGPHAIKIFFENEANKAKYIGLLSRRVIGMQSPSADSPLYSPQQAAVN